MSRACVHDENILILLGIFFVLTQQNISCLLVQFNQNENPFALWSKYFEMALFHCQETLSFLGYP